MTDTVETLAPTFADLARLPVWILWDANKKPHSAIDGSPQNSRDHCATLDRAKAMATQLGMKVGLVTGPIPDSDFYLGFVDIDSGVKDGGFLPHAKAVVNRFRSRVSLSSSGNGAHVLFLTHRADVEAVFNKGTKGDYSSVHRPPGHHNELSAFASGKYVALTDTETDANCTKPALMDLIGNPFPLRVVSRADLGWFHLEAGPAYAGKSETIGVDRSREALTMAMKFKRNGKTREQFEAAAESDEGPVGDWWRTKADDRQKERCWGRADHGAEPFDIAAALADDPIATAVETLPFGDTSNAWDFANAMRGELIYVPEQKTWLERTGPTWTRADALGLMQTHAAEKAVTARADAVGSKDWAAEVRDKEATRLWKSAQAQKAALESAQPMMTVEQEKLDTDAWLFGVQNGVLDLHTGRLTEPAPGQYVTKQAGTRFDPGARAPLWDSFLATVIPDPDQRDFIQRAVGYTLVGVPDEEVWFFAYGPGASGKSTFAAVCDALFGEYAGALHKDLLTVTKHAGETERQIVALQGKRLASVNETARNDLFDDAKIKRIVSREKIPARRLYGEAYGFHPTHTVWMRGNYKPGVMDGTDAMWRRMVPIRFGVQIPEAERQPDLHARIIRDELSGVLNWALKGALDWQRMGLAIPEAVEAERQEYRASTDFFGQWLAESVEEKPIHSEAHGALFESWCRWCAHQGQNSGSTNSFSKELSARGFSTSRIKTERRWRGLKLREGFGP
jgi:putative DNA primase/helicase